MIHMPLDALKGYGDERYSHRGPNNAVRRWWRMAIHPDERGKQGTGGPGQRHYCSERQGDTGSSVGEQPLMGEERTTEQSVRRTPGAPDPPRTKRLTRFLDSLRVSTVHDAIDTLREQETAANTAVAEIQSRIFIFDQSSKTIEQMMKVLVESNRRTGESR